MAEQVAVVAGGRAHGGSGQTAEKGAGSGSGRNAGLLRRRYQWTNPGADQIGTITGGLTGSRATRTLPVSCETGRGEATTETAPRRAVRTPVNFILAMLDDETQVLSRCEGT